jgi:predicted ATPase
MLIEFSVSNFRSFREKQTFSMVAAPRLKKGDNVFKPALKGEKLPDLLKVAAIYGPNASGKSNLIKALGIVRDIAKRQPSAESTPFPISPFRFDPQLADQPCQIELHFVCAEQRYEFQLALTQERIVKERLIAFPKGKETLLYNRSHSSGSDEYTFGQQLEGGKDLHELWKKATSPQVLFLAQAVANSSESLNQLKPPLQWLQTGFMVFSGSMEALKILSQRQAESDSTFANDLSAFLQEVDVPITNIRFDQVEPNSDESISTIKLKLIDTKPNSRTLLTHRTALGEAEFDFQEESEGTKNLIGFWLPWHLHNKSRLIPNFNVALVIDEFDSSLHPEIVASLVEKHLKSQSSSQLIFTTHDTHLMDTKLLRRDQFWLTERDTNGATQLRSIHDFEGREGEDLEKRYYEGRYRGLPFVRKA